MAERRPILEFENVTVSFAGTPALDNLSFLVREGDSRIILGAAGSGKSVLMKTALGLLKPDQGAVKVFGEDTSKLSETQWFAVRRKLGVLFQEGGLFDSLTIEENVAYPLENNRVNRPSAEEIYERTKEALEFVELGGTLDKVPSELSGGMRRRVGIARAMVTNPTLTLYDSPTAGLDPITSYTIVALIAKERCVHNTTTMIATHRYQDGHFLANYTYNGKTHRIEPVNRDGGDSGTRFWVLRNGRFAFEGTQSDLEETDDPYVRNFMKPRMKTYGKQE
ncbi:MAG: ATP-binding cassette domain-containing protein [Bryobacterales bacterium]|nr:ATP-binding cassette domain-containing protein [Bryobacterales bacterium]